MHCALIHERRGLRTTKEKIRVIKVIVSDVDHSICSDSVLSICGAAD